MPLGISESLIQRAYAPVDLSGFYNGIDQASKRIIAEQRAEKIAAQKDYFNSQAIINKDMGGIKSQDMSEVNSHSNKWKSLQKQLMKTSFERNPDEYARLNAEANAEYGATLSTIELSKQKKKEHEAVLTHMMQNPTKYKKNARTAFMNRMLLPTSCAINSCCFKFCPFVLSDTAIVGPGISPNIEVDLGFSIFSSYLGALKSTPKPISLLNVFMSGISYPSFTRVSRSFVKDAGFDISFLNVFISGNSYPSLIRLPCKSFILSLLSGIFINMVYLLFLGLWGLALHWILDLESLEQMVIQEFEFFYLYQYLILFVLFLLI